MKRALSDGLAVFIVAAVATTLLPRSARAEDPLFTLGVGAEYTTGDYGGDESVDEFYVPVSATLELERVALRLTVPFLSVRAPELTTISGPDGEPIVGTGPRTTESGLGDVLASITVFDVLTGAGGDLALDLTGKVKFGTADEDKGLGTGEQDYSLQADVYRFFEHSTLMGTLGYSKRGDPAGYDLDDTLFASLGATWAVAEGVRLGAFYDFRQASVPGSDDLHEVSGSLLTRVGEHARAQVYMLAGFSDSSPDWGGGVSLSASF